MRNKLSGIINVLFFSFFKILFWGRLPFFKKKVLVLDIDNTIADTVTAWKNGGRGDSVMFMHLQSFTQIHQFIDTEFPKTKFSFVFISARPISLYFTTRRWLRNNNYCKIFFPLFLVSKAYDKVGYLKILCKSREVYYIDDLSYNLEKGKIKFYNEVLDIIRHLPIKYYGYKEITKINNLDNEANYN